MKTLLRKNTTGNNYKRKNTDRLNFTKIKSSVRQKTLIRK